MAGNIFSVNIKREFYLGFQAQNQFLSFCLLNVLNVDLTDRESGNRELCYFFNLLTDY